MNNVKIINKIWYAPVQLNRFLPDEGVDLVEEME
jgi:hypothetical protein